MIEYKLAPQTAEGQEQVIEKHGSVHSFTASSVRENVTLLEKLKKGLTSQIELENAKLANVESFHEVVKTLTPEQMTAASIYIASLGIKAEAEIKLAEVEKALQEELAAVAEIKEKLGLDLLAIEHVAQLAPETEVVAETSATTEVAPEAPAEAAQA